MRTVLFQRLNLRKAYRLALVAGLLALFGLAAASSVSTRSAQAATPPIVNGLFYGDDDNEAYWEYATSIGGSKLYIFFDDPTLYVALVVDRGVNDNIFSPDADYRGDAGWTPPRGLTQLTNSEFASFTLECEASPQSWTWRQSYGFYDAGTTEWYSDSDTGPGAGFGDPPPSYVSSSSIVWNLNHYENNNNPTGEWNMYVWGAAIDSRTSPYANADPTTGPPLDGYPATGPIVYSDLYEWEWPMVYEWSVDLNTAGCGDNPIFVIAGESHHSPAKNDVEDDSFPDCEGEDCFLKDWGDLPDSYNTLSASGGPSHRFVVNNATLGPLADPESNGKPSAGANGDDIHNSNDDDGVTRNPDTAWTNGANVEIDFDVQCSGTNADLAMWIDWDGNGTFEADEYYTFLNVPCNAVYTGTITVPGASDYTVGDSVYVRVRIFNDETDAPGGSLDSSDYGGVALSGEVEDYLWNFDPTAITLEEITAFSDNTVHPALMLGMLLTLGTAALLLLRSSRKRTG